jgi:hypothetical protein
VAVYLLSSPGPTPYNYFTRLSEAFLNNRLYLTDNPSWLNELVPRGGRYFVVYPPMPAIVMIPWVALFGKEASQAIFSILLGALNASLVFILIKKLKFPDKTAILVAIFFAFGTDHWYLASVGSAWFISHVVALTFLFLALIETFGRSRLLVIGLLLGASFWSRTTVIFTLPFFYIFLAKKFWPINKQNLFNFFLLNFGVGFFVILDFYYNFVRFGSINALAPYLLIPNISNDPVFSGGFMSLKFIPRHLEAAFWKLPKPINKFPFLVPSLYSMPVWFSSPALFLILKAGKSRLALACFSAVILTFLVISTWAGVGYAQFGYRFVQDFMPFLLILLALSLGQRPGKLAYGLIALSILVNLWGVVMINKLGTYTF